MDAPKFRTRIAWWPRARPSRIAVDSMVSEPQNDTGDFTEIARRHDAYLQKLALNLTGNAADAKDLHQETLLRASERFDSFRQETNARAWLATIMTNLFRDDWKHRKVVANAEGDLKCLAVVEYEPLVSGITDAQLRDAVDALDPEQRELIELRYFKQMKYKEIAERLKAPVGTIGTRLMRTHELLKQLLTPPDDEKS
jgi:RNA polymerase sigma-70 factor (ECF subfamily)